MPDRPLGAESFTGASYQAGTIREPGASLRSWGGVSGRFELFPQGAVPAVWFPVDAVPGVIRGSACPAAGGPVRGGAPAVMVPGQGLLAGEPQFSAGDRGATSTGASRHWPWAAVAFSPWFPGFISAYPCGDMVFDHCAPAGGPAFTGAAKDVASAATVGNMVPGPALIPNWYARWLGDRPPGAAGRSPEPGDDGWFQSAVA